MPSLFPSASCLASTFGQATPYKTAAPVRRSPYQVNESLYPSWDVSEKASELSNEAVKEFEKASAAAQAKTGKIELYSGKYYAVCMLAGGIGGTAD